MLEQIARFATQFGLMFSALAVGAEMGRRDRVTQLQPTSWTAAGLTGMCARTG
ncbi:MAG: hypothetical protein R3B98_00370 [Hyphomonas sp.]